MNITATEASGLRIQDVVKSYDGVPVLKGIDTCFAPGQVTALLGSNGAGKSTLVKIVGGSVRPDRGKVLLDGKALPDGNPKTRIDAGISMINQEVALVPQMSVAESLLVGREKLAGRFPTDASVRRVAATILERSGIETDISLDTPTRLLGPSQRQLLEIVIALSRNARVLLMDEPTASLSKREVQGLFDVMRRLAQTGHVLILVSHRMDEVMDISDRVVVLRDGRISLEAAKNEIGPNDVVAAMVGERPSAVGTRAAAVPAEEGQALLSATALLIPGLPKPIDLEIKAGEIVGITGAVGSGITELGQALGGALKPTSGELCLMGRSLTGAGPRRARQAGLAFLPEDRRTMGLILKQSILVNASLDALPVFSRAGIMRLAKERQEVAKAVDSVRLVFRSLDQTSALLSGGNQQKLLFSRMLLAKPRVYVLAQPTAGVDVVARAEIYSIVRQLAKDGAAIIVLSSDLEDITNLATRGFVLTRKQLEPVPAVELTDELALGQRVLRG